ncbi:diacylglycerol kinase catalytic domain-containing protein [Ditylenchus destructor]|nr:diacylglycerol kinase catalytic domain-containing protein [Ditylenchus destructor]
MNRVTKFGSLIWNHKKKTIFGAAVLAYGIHFAQKTDRQAKRYGQQTVSPTQRLGRITVLVNRAAKGGKAVNIFEKNALPLLHLAGFDVDVLKVKDKEEMESVARVLDRKDADCLYVVGGDGTVCRVLTGIFGRENGNSDKKLPLCIFPGGRHNKSLKNILPGIFDDEKDIRQYCESAMAIIENSYQSISPMKCEIINDENPAETKTFYLLSSVDAGWLEHCDQKQPKLWYWGSLKSKIVYLWEFAKKKSTSA